MLKDDTMITISKSQFDNISLTSCNITIFTSLAMLFIAITLATGFVLGDVLLASLFAILATFNASNFKFKLFHLILISNIPLSH